MIPLAKLKCYFAFLLLSGSLSAEVIYRPDDWHWNGVKAVVFGLDGVLRVNHKPIEGAGEYISLLKKKNIPAIILTNESRYTEEELRDELSSLGVYIPQDWTIYSGAKATQDFFREKILRNHKKTYVYILGDKGLKVAMEELEEENLDIIEQIPADLSVKDPLYIVVGNVDDISTESLTLASQLIHKGAKVIVTSPNVTGLRINGGKRPVNLPGKLVEMLRKNLQCKVYTVGKPNSLMLGNAIKILREKNPYLLRHEILLVGDSIETDIQVGIEGGLQTALVLSGVDDLNTLDNSIMQPDIVADSINSLKHSYIYEIG